MIMEYWVGWFDTWGNKHNVKDARGKYFAVFDSSRDGPESWTLQTCLC